MPVALERKLKREADKKGIKDKDAYVYGTLRKTGWKPNREKKMSNPSKLVRLNEIGKTVDSIINFAYEDPRKSSLAGGVAKVGAAGAAGAAGLYGYGLTRRGVSAGPWGSGLYKAAGQDIHNVGSAMAAGRAPSAAFRDIGSSVAAGGRGVGQGFKLALQRLKTFLPSVKGLSANGGMIRFDDKKEDLLEPASEGQVPNSKIMQEEFPAGLSPAAVLKFPFPKLMRFLQQKNILQQQYSGLSAKLDALIQFADDDQLKHIRRMTLVGAGAGALAHGGLNYALARPIGGQIQRGLAIGGGLRGGLIGAGLGLGIGALTRPKKKVPEQFSSTSDEIRFLSPWGEYNESARELFRPLREKKEHAKERYKKAKREYRDAVQYNLGKGFPSIQKKLSDESYIGRGSAIGAATGAPLGALYGISRLTYPGMSKKGKIGAALLGGTAGVMSGVGIGGWTGGHIRRKEMSSKLDDLIEFKSSVLEKIKEKVEDKFGKRKGHRSHGGGT